MMRGAWELMVLREEGVAVVEREGYALALLLLREEVVEEESCRAGACGAGREGVRDEAVTWL